MKKGTLVLFTEGGERKMSYSLVNDSYYMATKSTSNKIKQIKANNSVSIDLNSTTYNAKLVNKDSSDYITIQSTYLSTMPKIQRFMYENIFGKKNDMFIILNNK